MFDDTKIAINQAVCLFHPDPEAPFKLTTGRRMLETDSLLLEKVFANSTEVFNVQQHGLQKETCHDCQALKINQQTLVPLQKRPLPDRRFGSIHVDLVGPHCRL